MIKPSFCSHEDFPCCGCGEESTQVDYAEMHHVGWPGDGSGEDDLADYNANEADDYAGEGADDASAYEGGEDEYLDASYEDRTDIDYGGDW